MFSTVLSLNPGKKIIFLSKLVILAGLLVYVGRVARSQPLNWELVQTQWREGRHTGFWASCILLLMPVNWGLEALKWQLLLRRVVPSTFPAAFRGVLAGVTLGFVLPAQLGDTAGRVLSLQSRPAEAIGASLVSGGMQFYVALVGGAFAWASYLTLVPQRATRAGMVLLAVLMGLVGAGVVLGVCRQSLVKWLEHRPQVRRFSQYWAILGWYTHTEIGTALGVAGLRYLVFSMQFLAALQLMGIGLPPAVLATGIGLVFLVKTITPAFNLLSDLGVREAASLWVFEPFGVLLPLVLTATLLLWVANILIPVLVGTIWVWKLK